MIKKVIDGIIGFFGWLVAGAKSALAAAVKTAAKTSSAAAKSSSAATAAATRPTANDAAAKPPAPEQCSFATEIGGQPESWGGPEGKPAHKVKSPFVPLKKGTLFLIDGANLIGEFHPGDAATVLRDVKTGLAQLGYRVHIYLERRTIAYLGVAAPSAQGRLKSTVKELGVTIIEDKSEADLPILQLLTKIESSVAVTNDIYREYGESFPDIVGSKRLLRFSVSAIGGTKYLSIDGIAQVIEIGAPAVAVRRADVDDKPDNVSFALSEFWEPKRKRAAKSQIKTEELVANQFAAAITKGMDEVFAEELLLASVPTGARVHRFAAAAEGGLVGCGKTLMAKGKLRAAARCFHSLAAHCDPDGFKGLAKIYAERGDERTAGKYARLGERLVRRNHEKNLRRRRLAAESRKDRRGGYAKCA